MSKYIILVLLLAGCAPEGTKYIEPDKSSMIIYRLPVWTNARSGTSVSVQVNGNPACDLHSASYFLAPLAKNTISVSQWDMPGTSRVTTDKRFVRIDINTDKRAAMAFGGLLGALMAEGMSDKSGQFTFTEVDPVTAHNELKDLIQDCK